MSLYAVNAFMRLVNMHPQSLRAYLEDPRDLVDRFEQGHAVQSPPWAEVFGTLTDEERAALYGRDYGALYAMGAHPYLLWSFTEAVWVPEISRAELVERFRRLAALAGYPDHAT